jgi:hypothetical protein
MDGMFAKKKKPAERLRQRAGMIAMLLNLYPHSSTDAMLAP